jgi:hypothetical protein
MDMEAYCPCPGYVPGGFCGGTVGGGTGGTGGAVEEMCPSMGASADARLITPMTTRITGHFWPNLKPLWVCSRRNSTPTVMTTAGPIKLLMVHRRQLQRIRSLICIDL